MPRTTSSQEGVFAAKGHDEGFGPVARYKDGDVHVCNTAEELAEFDENGWKDEPQPKKAVKPKSAKKKEDK